MKLLCDWKVFGKIRIRLVLFFFFLFASLAYRGIFRASSLQIFNLWKCASHFANSSNGYFVFLFSCLQLRHLLLASALHVSPFSNRFLNNFFMYEVNFIDLVEKSITRIYQSISHKDYGKGCISIFAPVGLFKFIAMHARWFLPQRSWESLQIFAMQELWLGMSEHKHFAIISSSSSSKFEPENVHICE